MGYVYATINKDTLAHICKEKGVSSEFLASKTKLNMSRLNQWLTPTDINLPTINQAKKIAACLHIPFAGLYMNPCDIPLKRIPNIRNMRTMSGAVSIDDSSLNIAMIDVLLERDFLLSADDEFGITPPDFEPLSRLFLTAILLMNGQMRSVNNSLLILVNSISVVLHANFTYMFVIKSRQKAFLCIASRM